MKTDLLEHFNTIEDKGWEIYEHNIGLKGTAKYKASFWIKTANNQLQFYNKEGNLLSTVAVTSSSFDNIERAVFSPGHNRMFYLTRNASGGRSIDIIEVSSGTLISTLVISVDGASVVDIATDLKGNLYVLNDYTKIIRKYDKNGNLLSTSTVLGTQRDGATALLYWKKQNVLWYTNANAGGGIIMDAASYTSRISNISNLGERTAGILKNGKLWALSGTAVRFTTVDYINNVATGTSAAKELRPSPSTSDWEIEPLGEIKGKLYFGIWRIISSEYYIAEIDEAGNITHTNVGFPVYAMDAEHYYSHDSAAFKVYKKSNLSLVHTIASPFGAKLIGSTKGDYANFYEYW